MSLTYIVYELPHKHTCIVLCPCLHNVTSLQTITVMCLNINLITNRVIVKEFLEHNVLELNLQYLMGRAAIAIHEQGYISPFQTWEISQNTV